jgi:hypothetical protein
MSYASKDVLNAALLLLRNGDNWVKGNGRAPDPYDVYTAMHFACAHQMASKYMWRYHDRPEVTGLRALMDSVGVSKIEELISWNDSSLTTWEDVENAFRKAIQFS